MITENRGIQALKFSSNQTLPEMFQTLTEEIELLKDSGHVLTDIVVQVSQGLTLSATIYYTRSEWEVIDE